MADNVADFLTFISPICILVLFFMCFFRFLFRSCECGTRDNDDLESCPSSRPTSSTTARIHPICQIHPDMNPFGEFIIHCPAHCEETFPPKYEDALKMAVCTARSENNNERRLSLPIPSSRPSVTSPPPIYNEIPNETNRSTSPTPTIITTSNELPPSYTMASQTLIPTSASRRRDSLSLPTAILSRSPINSTEASPDATIPTTAQRGPRLSRASLDEIYAHFPTTSTSSTSTSTGPIQLRAATLSAMNRNHRGVSARPPRVHLPGAVIENEEEEEEYYNNDERDIVNSQISRLALDSPNSNALRPSASF